MLFVLLGSSGSGKTTLGEDIFGKQKELVSFTTRQKRVNEEDGVDYHFITKETFNGLLDNKGLAEHTIYAGNYYGLTMSEIESKTENGDCYAVMDFNGYKQLKELYPETISIFVSATKDTLMERLKDRGETESFIEKRMKQFDKESELVSFVDLVIDNNQTLDYSLEQFRNYLRPYMIIEIELLRKE